MASHQSNANNVRDSQDIRKTRSTIDFLFERIVIYSEEFINFYFYFCYKKKICNTRTLFENKMKHTSHFIAYPTSASLRHFVGQFVPMEVMINENIKTTLSNFMCTNNAYQGLFSLQASFMRLSYQTKRDSNFRYFIIN